MTPSDRVIDTELIEAHLRWDARITHDNIAVDVDGGHVTLHGTVPSYYERQTATDNVSGLSGVDSVSNQLDVKYPDRRQVPSDGKIRAYIVLLIEQYPVLDASEIDVKVTSGHVELDGIVDTYWQKLMIEDRVANTTGVVEISNRLAVVPGEDVADEAVAKDIMTQLRNNPMIDVDQLNVTVADGFVGLSGNVPNIEVYRSILDIVAFTFGVIDVNSHLLVNP